MDTRESTDLEKSISHIVVEIIEYVPNSVVIKTIRGLTEKTSPFDTFAQIIEGKAEIVIDKRSNVLESGQGIIIPPMRPIL
jgi:hypothetical protein